MKTSLKILTILIITNHLSFGQDLSAKIDSIIRESYQNNSNVGVSVGFLDNSKEYYMSYGKINRESQTDICKNSVFEIGSITKVLTANLVAQAVLEGKIRLDDYIDHYLPKQYTLNENIKNKITVSDLASHQSGLTDLDFKAAIALDSQQPMNRVKIMMK